MDSAEALLMTIALCFVLCVIFYIIQLVFNNWEKIATFVGRGENKEVDSKPVHASDTGSRSVVSKPDSADESNQRALWEKTRLENIQAHMPTHNSSFTPIERAPAPQAIQPVTPHPVYGSRPNIIESTTRVSTQRHDEEARFARPTVVDLPARSGNSLQTNARAPMNVQSGGGGADNVGRASSQQVSAKPQMLANYAAQVSAAQNTRLIGTNTHGPTRAQSGDISRPPANLTNQYSSSITAPVTGTPTGFVKPTPEQSRSSVPVRDSVQARETTHLPNANLQPRQQQIPSPHRQNANTVVSAAPILSPSRNNVGRANTANVTGKQRSVQTQLMRAYP